MQRSEQLADVDFGDVCIVHFAEKRQVFRTVIIYRIHQRLMSRYPDGASRFNQLTLLGGLSEISIALFDV